MAWKGLPIRSQGRRFEAAERKTGAQVVLRPRFLGIAVVCRRFLRRLVELRVVQVGVEAALGEQLVVRALLDDIAVADY